MAKRKIFNLIFLITIILPVLSFAESDSYSLISTVIKSVLGAFSWFAYAISLGMLIWIGIKFVLSGANEKAKLKGILPNYLIGVILILLCGVISSSVVKIAYGEKGGDDSEKIINTGIDIGNINVGEREKD